MPTHCLTLILSYRRTIMLLTMAYLSLFLIMSISVSATPIKPRQTATQRRLVVFGDSYSDDGNGAWIASNMIWPIDPAYYNHSFS